MNPEDKDPNEGEGNKTAARRYNEESSKFVADHPAEKAPSLRDRLKSLYRRVRNKL